VQPQVTLSPLVRALLEVWVRFQGEPADWTDKKRIAYAVYGVQTQQPLPT
jgi:hypothetical protein